MNDAQHRELEGQLERRAGELQDTIAGLRGGITATRTEPGEVKDGGEDGDARNRASMDLVQLARHEEELREVLAARERMRQGLYGRCEACDEDIPVERLRARPEARFCLQHEEEWEKTHPVRVPIG
ncbi:MAG TPA: TraR/DksA C4-type zinc finger protein [Ramlibacter sp.]|nr:TraR/DksA C4-type zinc finger protein [Ramlibacter sp.]